MIKNIIRLALLLAAASASATFVRVAINSFEIASSQSEIYIQAIGLFFIGVTGLIGTLLSAFAKEYLRRINRIRYGFVIVALAAPAIDLIALLPHDFSIQTIAAHSIGSLFFGAVVAFGIATAWISWFDERQIKKA